MKTYSYKQDGAELLTEAQAATYLSIKPRTIRLWRDTRGLPHLKITSKVTRYRIADLSAWLERYRTAYPPRAHRRSRVIPLARVTCEARTNPVQSQQKGLQ